MEEQRRFRYHFHFDTKNKFKKNNNNNRVEALCPHDSLIKTWKLLNYVELDGVSPEVGESPSTSGFQNKMELFFWTSPPEARLALGGDLQEGGVGISRPAADFAVSPYLKFSNEKCVLPAVRLASRGNPSQEHFNFLNNLSNKRYNARSKSSH